MNDEFSSSRKRNRKAIITVIGIVVILVISLAIQSLVKKGKDKGMDEGAIGKITEMQGRVMIKRGADTVPYVPDFVVHAGDMLQSMPNTIVKIRYDDDGTEVGMGENTTLLFNANTGGKRTNLSGGTVTFAVPEQSEEYPMVLASYNSEATVLTSGTYIQKFVDIATHFQVIDGKLRIRRFSDGDVVEVKSGETHICKAEDSGVITFQP